MLYEDFLALWLAFLLIELSPKANFSFSIFAWSLFFLSKELIFFLYLIFLKSLKLRLANYSFVFYIFNYGLIFLLFTVDLAIFGFKKFFIKRYFGFIPLFLLFLHYYFPYRLIVSQFNYRYLLILLALIFPLFSLYCLFDLTNYFALNFPGKYLFLIFLILSFSPPIMVKILPCQKLKNFYLRNLIEAFISKFKIKFKEILVLLPVGAQFYTAGIIGFLPPFRYLFFSQPLLNLLDDNELLAVISHEIAHIKNRHGLLLIFLFFSFSLLLINAIHIFFLPFVFIFDSVDEFLDFFERNQIFFEVFLGFYFLGVALLMFRFIFAYFLRSFEREADLYASLYLGDVKPLVGALLKVGEASNRLWEKSWHHYGIMERVAFLLNFAKKVGGGLGEAIELGEKFSRRIRFYLFLWTAGNVFIGFVFQLLGASFWERLLKFFLS